MSEITVSKLDSDPRFKLTFQPIDAEKQPVQPTGVVSGTISDTSIATLEQAGDSKAIFYVTPTGKAGKADIVIHDDIASVTAHLVISSGNEIDATLIVS